jgi:hypothetical protein
MAGPPQSDSALPCLPPTRSGFPPWKTLWWCDMWGQSLVENYSQCSVKSSIGTALSGAMEGVRIAARVLDRISYTNRHTYRRQGEAGGMGLPDSASYGLGRMS